jgi:hypothetical protein
MASLYSGSEMIQNRSPDTKMIEVLAEQIQEEMVQDIHQEIEGIYQELVQLEKHHRLPVKPVVSKHEQPLLPPTTLKGIVKDAMDQATREEGLSQKKKKKWLLLAERLEEAHRLGIYKEPVNTICRFICLIHPTAKHNTIRKALSYKYKEPNQSRIACRQMKGLTASIWRHNKKKKMASSSRYWPQVSEEVPPKKIASNSVTPYKDMARSSYYYTFASWLTRCKKKKYNTGIFEKIKKDKAFRYLCRDIEFALWYLEEVYHPSKKELSTVRKAMENI